jgi:hypothetical protein
MNLLYDKKTLLVDLNSTLKIKKKHDAGIIIDYIYRIGIRFMINMSIELLV